MTETKYLPLGSIIKLCNVNKKILIISRGLAVKDGNRVRYYEYGGCTHPEGMISDKMIYFDCSDISDVLFEGYSDKDDIEIMNKVDEWRRKHNKG